MTKIFFALMVLFMTTMFSADAQRMGVRLNFPLGVHIRPASPAPFGGAVWIGPEWTYRGGRYVHAPGYWGRPAHSRAVWVPGYWKYKRRGYVWVSGRWR
jgi:hypothetical protein